jgi:DNA-binding response OmpR family regulator
MKAQMSIHGGPGRGVFLLNAAPRFEEEIRRVVPDVGLTLAVDAPPPAGPGVLLAEWCRELHTLLQDPSRGISGAHHLWVVCNADEAEQVADVLDGADDILIRPIPGVVLRTKIRSWQRRWGFMKTAGPPGGDGGGGSSVAAPVPGFGPGMRDLFLDVAQQTCTVRGQPLGLSVREFEVLRCLTERTGQTVSRDQLERYVGGDAGGRSTNGVEVVVCLLRQKLQDCGLDGVIDTVRNRGYRIG